MFGSRSGKNWGGASSNSTNKDPYDIDYTDDRFTKVEAEKKEALTDLEQTYGDIIGKSDKYYDDQIQASKDWADKQTQLQQEKSDFAIEQIEQQKEQAREDYIDDQSASYVDWKEQSNEYGAQAEQRAAQGLSNTGFSESSQVSMWNTYQNRVTTAREVYQRAVLNFNNAITEARLQNNAALAEIAYNALQQQLELSLQGFQYKNTLLLEQYNKQLEVDQMYYTRWQDVLEQMNTENALAEQIRQFNESMALQRDQFEWQVAQASDSGSSGGGGGSYSSSYSSSYTPKKQDTSGMASDTRDSILALGQGPISAENLANQVASGKVNQSTSTTTGNAIFTQGGLQTSTPKTSSSSSSTKSAAEQKQDLLYKKIG